jgi:hypothetical protein
VHKYDIMFGETAIMYIYFKTVKNCMCLPLLILCVKHLFFLDPNWIQSLYGVWCHIPEDGEIIATEHVEAMCKIVRINHRIVHILVLHWLFTASQCTK